jgi:MYXO-CTERM domain-containing protein
MGFFEVGAKIDHLYYRAGEQCTAASSVDSVDYYRLGQPIAVTSFPAATFTKQAGIQRTTTPSGATVATSFLDRAGAKSCNPMQTSDGKVRCVPQPDAYLSDQFADASCTQRVYVPVQTTPNCPAGAAPKLALDYPRGQLYDVSSTTRETAVYTKYNGACQLSSTMVVRDIAPADLATFDELTLSEESCHPTLGTCSETCASDATCNGGFCQEGVCIAKIADAQPIPTVVGTCSPDLAKRVCMSGECHDDACGPKPAPSGSSSSTSGSGTTSANDDDDSVTPPATSSSGGATKPSSHAENAATGETTTTTTSETPKAPAPEQGGCNTTESSGSPAGALALAAVVFASARRRRAISGARERA